MIKNDRQYAATLSQLALLRAGLKDAIGVLQPDVFVKSHITSLETDIAALAAEAKEFKSLKAGKFNLDSLDVVAHLGSDLVRARIARNMTQKQLAEVLGKKEQAIQRYEDTEYRSANLETLAKVVGANCAD